MILSDKQILEARERGDIVITPFDPKCLGSNSYDVHLGEVLATYRDAILDAKENNEVEYLRIPEHGMTLYPGMLYLAVTIEHTFTQNYVPYLEGKSSSGRLGIFIHITAAKGDNGFKGHFTLEITVVKPVNVYAGMPIGQLTYFPTGECLNPYNAKETAKYNNEFTTDPKPIPYMGYKNFK